MKFQAYVSVLPDKDEWRNMPFFKWLTYRKTHRTRIIIFYRYGPARMEK